MRVAGDGKEVVRRAAGTAARLVSAVEVLALFDVSDAPNLLLRIFCSDTHIQSTCTAIHIVMYSVDVKRTEHVSPAISCETA